MFWERHKSPGDMDIGQLCSILAACMSTNPEQRKAGEATLEQVVFGCPPLEMPLRNPEGAGKRGDCGLVTPCWLQSII